MKKQIYLVHVTDVNNLAINIEHVDVLEQKDEKHFLVETVEDGVKDCLIFTLGVDAAETLEDVYYLFLQLMLEHFTDAMSQLKRAFQTALENAETMDASSGVDGLTESEHIAQEGAIVSSIFSDLGFQAQLALIKFMRFAREAAD